MKGYEARNLLNSAILSVSNLGFQVEPLSEMSITQAGFLEFNNKRGVYVGVKEFNENAYSNFLDKFAVMPVINLFHEVYGHGVQLTTEFEKDCPLSKALALNYYACKCSNQYYGISSQGTPLSYYFDQPHEIAAQYAGVYAAYRFLGDIYGRDKAENMICDCENERIDLEGEFGHPDRKFTCVSDVLSHFNKSFSEFVFLRRQCDLRKDTNSIFSEYIRGVNGNYYFDRIDFFESGLQQDHLMTSIYLKKADLNGIVKRKPVFSGMDMSPKSILKITKKAIKSLPDKGDLLLKQINAELDRIYEKDRSEKNSEGFEY